MVKFSVIIPTYNRGYLIGKALGSVYRQTWKDYEIIVVDDGSTDNTREILKEESFRNDKVKYVRHKVNRGVSAARNTGILHSNGEYIDFLDSDDRWLPSKLNEQMRVLRSYDGEIGLVYTGYRLRRADGGVVNFIPKYDGYVFDKLLNRNFISCSSVVVPKKIFDVVGMFDERLLAHQDYDMWLRIAKKYPIKLIPKPLVECYVGGRDRLSLKYTHKVASHYRILRKHLSEIESLKLKHKHYFYIGKLLIYDGNIKCGRYFLIKAFLDRRKIQYAKFLFVSLLNPSLRNALFLTYRNIKEFFKMK